MKTIWIFNHYAADPAFSSAGSRHFSLARELRLLGWTPVIFAASTSHPAGTQRASLNHGNYIDKDSDGVLFRFFKAPSYSSKIQRIFNILAFTSQILKPSSYKYLNTPEIIIGSTVHPFAALAALIVAKRYKIPYIFEIRDLWPQTLIDMGVISRHSPVTYLLRVLELYICNRAEQIITPLPFASEYLSSIGVPTKKITWISNGTDFQEFEEIQPVVGKKYFTFMYFGSVGLANGVEILIDSFLVALETNKFMKLIIVGEGAVLPDLQSKVTSSPFSNLIEFRSPVPKYKVQNAMQEADALLINILELPVYNYGVSMNKIYDYAAASKPIVLLGSPRNNFVEEADSGITIPGQNTRLLSEKMLEISKHSMKRQREVWGRNGYLHAKENYSYSSLAVRLDSLLTSIMDQRIV